MRARDATKRDRLAPLANRSFIWILVGYFMGVTAHSGHVLVRGWLVYVMSDGSEIRLGLLALAMALPMALLAPFGGVLADRMSRRKIIWIGQVVVAIVELGCLYLLVSGVLEFWHLIVCSVVVGSSFPLFIPARNSMIANLFGARDLTDAMALSMAVIGVARVAGPAVAGVMLARVGTEAAYGVSVVMYVVAALVTLGVDKDESPGSGDPGGVLDSLREGIQFLRNDRPLLFLLLFLLAPLVLSTTIQPLFASFVSEVWLIGESGLGWLGASMGLGGFAGALLLAWLGDSERRSRHILGSMVALCVLVILFAHSPWFATAVGLAFLMSVASQYFFGLTNTSVQILVPDHVRGRITSFFTLAFSLPMLATIGIGALAEWIGVSLAFSLSAVLVGVLSLIWYRSSAETPLLDDRINRAQEAP